MITSKKKSLVNIMLEKNLTLYFPRQEILDIGQLLFYQLTTIEEL